jgi:hypothetical protein
MGERGSPHADVSGRREGDVVVAGRRIQAVSHVRDVWRPDDPVQPEYGPVTSAVRASGHRVVP